MKVALVGPAPPLRGGIAAHVDGLSRTLGQLGHEVAALSYARVYPRCLYPGSRTREAGAASADELIDTLDPRSWGRMRRWLTCGGFDAIVVEWWHPIVAPALLAGLPRDRRIPICLVVHNVHPHEWFPAGRSLLSALLLRATAIVCHSHYVAAAVAEMQSSVTVRVVPMPPLVDVASVLTRDRAEARKRLGLMTDVPLVALAGHLRGYKGLTSLLDAWNAVRPVGGARLVIAGEDYRFAACLRRRCRGSSVERITRYVSESELADLIAAVDCMVFPYLRASQSGLLPTARESGKVLIVTDVGGVAEQVRGYDHARVVPPNDHTALAAAISETIATGFERPSVALRQAVKRQAQAWSRLARACVEGIDEGLRGGGRRTTNGLQTYDRTRSYADNFMRGRMTLQPMGQMPVVDRS